MKIERITSIVAAVILLQTLYYKFTGAPESVYIFTELGVEPFGRIGTGVVELVIAILLISKKTSLWGSILGLGVISGAILSHVFVLGVVVQNDGGLLFGLAVLVFVLLSISLILQRDKLMLILESLKKGR